VKEKKLSSASAKASRESAQCLALRFLPVVAAQGTGQYDSWDVRWLAGWIAETPGATVEQAAELAGALAELPNEPSWFDSIRQKLP
jgi:hypothetical protein